MNTSKINTFVSDNINSENAVFTGAEMWNELDGSLAEDFGGEEAREYFVETWNEYREEYEILNAVEDGIYPQDEITFRVQVREYAKHNSVRVFATYTGWEYDYEVEVTSAEFENGEKQIVVTAEEITLAKSYLDNYASEMTE